MSRKWLAALTSAEETSTQVDACFLAALEAEDLLEAADERATAALREAIASGERDQVHDLAGGGQLPLLLAISDNGPQMRSVTTREFMAGVAIAQQFGRPHTPQDQAWIETLFGTSKANGRSWRRSATPVSSTPSWTTSGPSTTPSGSTSPSATSPRDDEHEGRGDAIRQQRRDGLAQAREHRIAYRRNTTPEENQ